MFCLGFTCGSAGKESACSAGNLGSILGLGRSPEEGKGYLLHNSCLDNSMDRGAWHAIVFGVAKSQAQLSDFLFTSLQYFPKTGSHSEVYVFCLQEKYAFKS